MADTEKKEKSRIPIWKDRENPNPVIPPKKPKEEPK